MFEQMLQDFSVDGVETNAILCLAEQTRSF